MRVAAHKSKGPKSKAVAFGILLALGLLLASAMFHFCCLEQEAEFLLDHGSSSENSTAISAGPPEVRRRDEPASTSKRPLATTTDVLDEHFASIAVMLETEDGLPVLAAAQLHYRSFAGGGSTAQFAGGAAHVPYAGPGLVVVTLASRTPIYRELRQPGELVIRVIEGTVIRGLLQVDGGPPGRELRARCREDQVDDGAESGVARALDRRILSPSFELPVAADGSFQLLGLEAPWSLNLELPYPLLQSLPDGKELGSKVKISERDLENGLIRIETTRAERRVLARIVDRNGRGIPDVKVTALINFSPRAQAIPGPSARTDEAGDFYLQVDWPSNLEFSLLLEKQATAMISSIDRRIEGVTHLGEIEFAIAGPVLVTVLSAEDEIPIPAARVNCGPATDPSITNHLGQCHLSLAAKSDPISEIVVLAEGYEVATVEVHPEDLEVTIHMHRSARILVQLVDDLGRPWPGRQLFLEPGRKAFGETSTAQMRGIQRQMEVYQLRFWTDQELARLVTDHAGKVIVSSLEPGTRLTVGAKDSPDGDYICGKDLIVESAGSEQRIDLMMPKDRFLDLELRVKDPDGLPVRGAIVTVSALLGGYKNGRTDAEGICSFRNLDVMTFGRSEVPVEVRSLQQGLSRLKLELPGRKNQFDVDLQRPVISRIQVEDSAGTAIETQAVRIELAQSRQLRGRRIAVGLFEFEDLSKESLRVLIDVGAKSWSKTYVHREALFRGGVTTITLPDQGLLLFEDARTESADVERIEFYKEGRSHMFFDTDQLPSTAFLFEAGDYQIHLRLKGGAGLLRVLTPIHIDRGKETRVSITQALEQAER